MNDMTPQPPLQPAMAMCRRDAEGRIVTVTREPLSAEEMEQGRWQAVPVADAELQAFLHGEPWEASTLSRSDSSLARVLEDLVDVLINRGLIQFTDLPEAAQAKLFDRRRLRARMHNRLDLLPDEGDDGLL